VLGLFGPEVVEYVELRHKTLTFRSKKIKKTGTHKVRFLLLINGKKEKLDLQVNVTSVRPADGGGQVCSGDLPVPEATLPTLEGLFAHAPRANLGRAARRSERHRLSLRVLSNDLPGFRGVTVDISLHGAQMVIAGALAVGKPLRLTIETDTSQIPRLEINGVVVWCREGERAKQFLIGVEFTQQAPEWQAELEKFYRIMEDRVGSDVMLRTLGDGDFYTSTPRDE